MTTVTTVALALSAFPLSAIVKATAVLAAALIAVHGMRRARASMRHLVLVSAFAVVLAMPLAGLVLPELTVPIERPSAVPSVVLPITMATPIEPVRAGSLPEGARGDEAVEASATISPRALFAGLWAAGVLVSLIPVMLTPVRLRQLHRTARHWPDGQTLLQDIGAGPHRVAVLRHQEVCAPLTCGVIRPAIVLPADAPRWRGDELRRALVHELEHIRRADWPIHVATRIVCAIYWFHPLAWIAWRRLGLEAERACDDAVLRMEEPTAYAQQLVTLARRHMTAAPLPALSMAGATDLSARVAAMLDETQARGRLGLARASIVIAAAALLTAAVAPLRAAQAGQTPQSPAASAPAFDVVSIKENKSGAQIQGMRRQPGGRLVINNLSVRFLILNSYGLQPQQLIGGPDWIDSARYDINAQAPGEFPIAEPGTVGAAQLMMQRMLAERFQLAVHTETRELPIYALTVARKDGRLGPRIRTAAIDCQAVLTAGLKKAESGGGMPSAPQRPDGGPGCGMRIGSGGQLTVGGTSMEALARILAVPVGRLVEDRTGLTGGFDFDLEYTVDPATVGAGAQLPPPVANAPSIFTALEEQLGLKLEAIRAPVEVLVIDRVERPTED